jgi:hypothetical protein
MINNHESEPFQLKAGVPQGSPLSPILFLFYNAPLLETLDLPDQNLSHLGFANDINLLIYGPTAAQNSANLSRAYDRCLI